MFNLFFDNVNYILILKQILKLSFFRKNSKKYK